MPTVRVPIEASVDDQSAFRDDTVWPPATAVNRSQAFVTVWAQKTFSTPNYRSRNMLLRFNTGNYLPNSATVTSATLEAVPQFVSTVDTKQLRIRWYDWDGALDADHTNADSDTGGAEAHAGVSFASFTVDTLASITLSNAAANVSVSGVSELRCTLTGGQPTGTNDLNFHSFDNTLSHQVPTLVVDYTLPSPYEAHVPVAGGSTTNLSTYDATAIDEPPGSGGTDWLTGTDPSGSSTGHGQQHVDNMTLWTGGTAHTWTSATNAYDANDTTSASYALGANTTDYMDHLPHNAADFTGIPSGATITDISVAVRVAASGSATRLTGWVQLATANGTLIGSEVALNGGANLPTSTADYTATLANFGNPTITRADLVTGTFGVRTRFRRSNTVTVLLFNVKTTVTYSTPQTTNTAVTAPMSNPTNTLATGAGTGEVRIQVRKLGTGSNPQARAEIWQTGGGAALATPIANTTVSLTSTVGTVLSGTFNQSVITVPNDVEVRVTGTGASGGLVEVGAIEWVAQLVPPATTPTLVIPTETAHRILSRR